MESEPSQCVGMVVVGGGGGRNKGWEETLEEKRGRRLGLSCVLPYLYHLTKARQVYKKTL